MKPVRTNDEFNPLYKSLSIIEEKSMYIKRLHWLGHVTRIEDKRKHSLFNQASEGIQ